MGCLLIPYLIKGKGGYGRQICLAPLSPGLSVSVVVVAAAASATRTMFEQFVEGNHLNIWLFELFDYFVFD